MEFCRSCHTDLTPCRSFQENSIWHESDSRPPCCADADKVAENRYNTHDTLRSSNYSNPVGFQPVNISHSFKSGNIKYFEKFWLSRNQQIPVVSTIWIKNETANHQKNANEGTPEGRTWIYRNSPIFGFLPFPGLMLDGLNVDFVHV